MRLGLWLGVRFRAETYKWSMRDFETSRHILQIAQIGKLRAAINDVTFGCSRSELQLNHGPNIIISQRFVAVEKNMPTHCAVDDQTCQMISNQRIPTRRCVVGQWEASGWSGAYR